MPKLFGLLRTKGVTNSKVSTAPVIASLLHKCRQVVSNRLAQQLLKLLGRHLQVAGKLRSQPRLWAALSLTALPSSDGCWVDAQSLSKSFLGEANYLSSLGKAVPLGAIYASLIPLESYFRWPAR